MDCPYPNCTALDLTPEADTCGTCRRPVKVCAKCHSSGRTFANFCRHCGLPFPGEEFHWSGFRGGPKRLGLNSSKPRVRGLGQVPLLPMASGSIRLGDSCLALLSWDSHLVAVSRSGQVEIVAPTTAYRRRLSVAGGPLTCQPCIVQSTLFLGQEGRLSAFSLAALTLPEPKVEPRWQIRVPGRPVDALLALGDRLFATVLRQDGRTGLLLVDHVSSPRPEKPRFLYTAERLSALAGDFLHRKVHFLSQEQGELQLHILESGSAPLQPAGFPLRDLGTGPLQNTVLAAMGSKLFGVFGQDDKLCRLEWGQGSIRLDGDVQKFAFNNLQQWVHVGTTGVHFSHLNQRESLNHMERVVGQPLIVRDFAFAVGLQDGRVLLYDFQAPDQQREIRVDSPEHGITALASFGPYLAAGSSSGKVELYEVVPP